MPIDQYEDAVQKLGSASPLAAAPSDPYEAAITERFDAGETKLRLATQAAQDTKPETAAEVLRLAHRTGLPPDLIARNLDQIRKRAAVADTPYGQMQRDTPALAQWLQEPWNASVAQDDHAALGGMERTLKIGRDVVGDIGAGLFGFNQQAFGLLRAGAEGLDALTRHTAPDYGYGPRWDEATQSYAGPPKGLGFLGPLKNTSGDVMTEFSIDESINGKNVSMPTLVPTLTRDEVSAVLAMKDGDTLPANVRAKAIAFAKQRLAAGQDPFAGPGEQQNIYPDLARETVPLMKNVTILQRLAEFSAAAAAQATALQQKALGPRPDSGLVEQSIHGGIQSIVQNVPSMALALMGAEVPSLALMGVSTGGGAYDQARTQGVSVPSALSFGISQGVIEVATEKIPLHKLIGDVAHNAGLLTILQHQVKSELIGENIATVLQDLNEWAVLPANKERTAMDYLRERPTAAAATTISTLVALSATTITGHATATMLHRLGQDVEQSKTVQRMPEAAQSFLADATKDTPIDKVYAPVDTWTTYWQSKGIDPAVIAAELTGDPRAYAQAKVTGEDLAIPTAAYAVQLAGTEHNAFFSKELRLAPEQMNGREAEAFQKDAAAQADASVPTPEQHAQAIEAQQIDATIASPELDQQVATVLGDQQGPAPEGLLDRLEREATARIQARGTFSGTRLGAGLPLDDLADIVLIGSVKVARGVRDFTAWSRSMLADYGERIRPHLATLFAKSLEQAGQRFAVPIEATREGQASIVTAQAVEQAQAVGQPLFSDAKSAGMSDEQFLKYQEVAQQASDAAKEDLYAKALRDIQREQSRAWLSAKQKIRATVTGELKPEPIYQARAALREELKGVPLEQVAELYGFSSADELRQALKATPGLNRAVAAETAKRLKAQFGDLLTDGRLADQAQQAVFGLGRQNVIEAELRALKGTIPPRSVLRQMAETRIAGTLVRDLRSGQFLMAAQRASQRAFDLLSTNTDRVGAVQAKQQELLNLALYREATQAKDRADMQKAYLKTFTTDATRARLGKAEGGFLDQIDGILEHYEFTAVTNKRLDSRTSLRKWIASMEAQGLPVELDEAAVRAVEDTRPINWRELTVDQLTGVHDAVKQIAHLARLKNRLLTAADNRDFTATVTAIDASIREHNVVKKLPLEFVPKDLKARKVSEWFASHSKIATLARALDGYEDGGQLWETVLRPINDAATTEAQMNTAATKALSTLMTDAYSGREMAHLHDKLFIPAINDSLSKEGRLAVALNWGNDGNRQRIRDGRHWTDAQVQAILGTLDQRDWTFVQGVWDFIDSYWPDIKAKQERVTGLAPEKVEATPVVTRFGTFKGGYYPLAYDSRLSAKAGSFIDANEATLQKQAAYVKATTRRGHTEARLERVTEPVRLELGVLYGHVEQVIHDLSHHEMLIDVGRVLGNKQVQQAIYETKGDQVYQQFRGALKDIAFGTRAASGSIERALNFIRQGTTVAGLAWNVWTAVQQPMGVFDGMARVGPSWVLKGMSRMVRDAAAMENTAAWIYDRSPMMKLRGSTQQREVVELRGKLSHPGGWFDNAIRTVTLDKVAQQDISDSYFFLIQQAQRLADMPTWLGQYEKSRAGGEDDVRAAALADQAVLDAQGGGQIKDLAEVQRGSPILKLFTNFYSYGNLKFNQTAEAAGRTNFRSAGSVGQFLVNLMLLYTFPAATTVLLAKAFGKGDDDESWATAMGRELIGSALNTMVLVREFGGFIRSTNRGYEGPTGTRAITAGYNLLTQVKQGEPDRALLRSAEDVGGILFRLPLAQVQRSVDGFVALQEGRTSNPLVLLSGAPKAAK
jgi:hypothetical protein